MKKLTCWQINETDFPTDNRREQLKFLLRYSVLSPSKYNRQPWKFEIISDDQVNFYFDLTSLLPIADPHRFELIFSGGAVLKSFLLAAEFYGFHTETKVFPDNSKADLFAEVKISDNGVRSSQALLCREIPRRTTARSDFAPGKIDKNIVADLVKSIGDFSDIALRIVEEEEEKKFIAKIIAATEERFTSTSDFHKELRYWLRTNCSRSNDGLPAWAFGISGLSSLFFPNFLYKKLLDPLTGKRVQMVTERAPIIAVIGTTSTEPSRWLDTGGAFMLLALTAAKYNLTVSTYDLLFNVPYLTDKLKHFIEETRYGAFNPRMIVRLGYSLRHPQTPRKALEEFFIKNTDIPHSNIQETQKINADDLLTDLDTQQDAPADEKPDEKPDEKTDEKTDDVVSHDE